MQWNLEQLEIFVGIAEGASFSAMARRLGRAQSAISSAIALLETDLGVVLFTRSNGRTPVITAAGLALLEEAREVLRQCQRLDSRAQALCAGQEPLLRLALDEAMPYQPVLDALDALAAAFPHLEVQLTSGAQGDVARKLLTDQADLGLLFRHEHMPEALERQALGDVAQVTACGAQHPLARQRGVGRRELARHRQLLIAPLEHPYPGGEQIAPQVWRADSFYLLAELLMRGLGWGWLPRHVARYPSYQGLLAELDCDWVPPALVVELAWRRNAAPGPAARWLAQRLAEELRAIG